VVWTYNEEKTIRVMILINVERRIRRGMPKKKWLDFIMSDMRLLVCIYIHVMGDRVRWKFRPNVADPR